METELQEKNREKLLLTEGALSKLTIPSDIVSVLLLEDDPADAELISTTLSNGDLNCRFTIVETCSAFRSALESQQVDIVLADYSLPAFDGLSAIELVKASFPALPCILVSGMLGEERAINALKSGATDYVLKQRLERLAPAVERALQEASARSALATATAELKASEARFRATVETMADCLILLSSERDENGLIQALLVSHLNRAACHYLSVSSDKHIGKPIGAVIPAFQSTKSANPDLFLSFCGVVETGYSFSEEVILNGYDLNGYDRPDGIDDDQFVAIDLRAAKFDDGVVLTWRDITEHKQSEHQRLKLLRAAEEARNHAEQANQFKDVFLANLSHELRSPLSSVAGWLQIASERLDDKKVIAKAIETSLRNTQLLDYLIADLLDVSRMSGGKFFCDLSPLTLENLAETIAEAIDSVSPSAKSKEILIELSVSQPADQSPNQPTVQIMGDLERLQQVVRNLLSNAIKFTPIQGHIDVSLEATVSSVTLMVKDTGQGIGSDVLPHIFQRFWQASDAARQKSHCGLGLGLSIVRYIVESHSGQVAVESAGAGQGSTFKVDLPLVSNDILLSQLSSLEESTGPDKSIGHAKTPAAKTLPSHHHDAITENWPTSQPDAISNALLDGCKVLVVEDYQDGLDVYVFMLEAYGATVRAARSADDALEIFQHFRPHVLVSDIGLPGKDGYEFIREIRALPDSAGGRVPAIALTAFTEAPYRTRALLAGFQHHIAKPIGLEQMAVLVSKLYRL